MPKSAKASKKRKRNERLSTDRTGVHDDQTDGPEGLTCSICEPRPSMKHFVVKWCSLWVSWHVCARAWSCWRGTICCVRLVRLRSWSCASLVGWCGRKKVRQIFFYVWRGRSWLWTCGGPVSQRAHLLIRCMQTHLHSTLACQDVFIISSPFCKMLAYYKTVYNVGRFDPLTPRSWTLARSFCWSPRLMKSPCILARQIPSRCFQTSFKHF